MNLTNRLAAVALLFTGGCSDVEVPEGCHAHGDELHCENHGLVSTVLLNFTPTDGGETLTFEWDDNNGDPIVEDIVLPDGSDGDHVAREYTLDVEVWNKLEDPAENVTLEIEEQADGHQFFFTGSAVQGPATGDNASAVIEQAYADSDDGGLPLGLQNTITTLARGTGELTITLRHMPMQNDQPLKVAGLAEDVAESGFGAIAGDNDAEVTFNLDVD